MSNLWLAVVHLTGTMVVVAMNSDGESPVRSRLVRDKLCMHCSSTPCFSIVMSERGDQSIKHRLIVIW